MNKTNATPTPRFDAFVVQNFTDKDQKEQSSWMRVGVAFPHKDNKGFNLELQAVPVGGKLVLREHDPKPTPTT
jgi:hypothetical protein